MSAASRERERQRAAKYDSNGVREMRIANRGVPCRHFAPSQSKLDHALNESFAELMLPIAAIMARSAMRRGGA